MDKGEQEKSRIEAQYDKLARRFNELYGEGRERGREAMAAALEKARRQLTELGEFGTARGEELKQYLGRDLDQLLADARQLGDEAREQLHPSRVGAGALASLADVLELTSKALHSLSDRTRKTLAYHTGEVTSAGTLTCQACGQKIHLHKTGHVPPCSKCRGTRFSKGY